MLFICLLENEMKKKRKYLFFNQKIYTFNINVVKIHKILNKRVKYLFQFAKKNNNNNKNKNIDLIQQCFIPS